MNVAHRNLQLLNILTFLFTFVTFEGVWVVYYASITGSFATALGMFAIMHVTSSTMEVPTGMLSDRIGRKLTIVLYCWFGFISMLLFYFAESTLLLLIGSITVGLSMAFGSGTISAFVYENLQTLNQTELYKKYEGKRRAQTKYSKVAAGVVGTSVIFLYDIRTAILITTVAIFISFVISLFLKNVSETKSNKNNIYHDIKVALRQFKTDTALRDFSLGRIFARGVGNAEYRFRSLFMGSLMPDWLVNLVIMVASLVSGLTMHACHALVAKFGFRNILVRFEIINRIIITICVIIYTPISVALLTVANSLNFGVRDVASEDLLQARYDDERRATMGSLVSLGGSIIYILVAAGSGFIADQIGLFYTMLMLQPILLISAYFYWRGLRGTT